MDRFDTSPIAWIDWGVEIMFEDCLDDVVGMDSPNDTSEEGLGSELVGEDGHLAGGGGQGGGLVDSIWQFVVQSVLVGLSNAGGGRSGKSNQSNRKGEEGKSSTVSGASLNKVLS